MAKIGMLKYYMKKIDCDPNFYLNTRVSNRRDGDVCPLVIVREPCTAEYCCYVLVIFYHSTIVCFSKAFIPKHR